MSRKHPIISITGSSGAGTTSVKKTFEQIFFREKVNAVYIEGDAFHRYDRAEMRTQMAKEADRGNRHFSHFSPEINLEWIQKLHRDRSARGYSTEAVTDTILRRMPDYIHYICPQFSETDINFQRVPTVDTSNPFIARWIPTPDESMVVIRFKNPRGIDFPYLLSMLPQSWMSRANSIVCPGAKLDLAMQLILTPLIMQLIERKRNLK